MKTFMTGQQSVIDNYGRDFAEYVYDKYRPGQYFRWGEVDFPAFRDMRSCARYTRLLLWWMIEQAPDHIQKVGHKYKL